MDCFPATNYNPSSSGSSSIANGSKEKKKDGKKSKGVKLSTDPQSVAARERRHRISDRFKILQSLVPGGSKMDTVSMLEEAIHYVKFLKTQIWLHQTMINVADHDQDPSFFLSAAGSSFPSHHQQTFYGQDNFVDQLQQQQQPSLSASVVPFPNSCFQYDEQNASFDTYVKY